MATTTTESYDNLGRLRWTQDGEGYINYVSYHPVMGTVAYQATDVDPASVSSDISSGSSGNWDDWTVGGANSNAPTRGSLTMPLALVTKTYYDAHGRLSQIARATSAALSVLQAEVLALGLQNVAAVREPVQDRSREPLAAEHLRPVLERQVGRNDHTGTLVGREVRNRFLQS